MWLAVVTQAEVSPLIDALGRNASLTHLDLSPSGIGWDGAEANGGPLIELMAKYPATLSALDTLIISQATSAALAVLRS